jgi:tRNA-Thr(GGU) m(6)t(6)A37 methyltransferase TsaA
MKRLFIPVFLFILLFATAREQKEQFILKPIGKVSKIEKSTKLILEKKYGPALQGLDKNSHVWVLWWFDRNDTPEKRSILQVNPCGNPENPLTGVFACRSPFRPNLIALSLCRILFVENNVVEIEKIDAFDETPILDLKPYIPGYDSADDAVTSKWKR